MYPREQIKKLCYIKTMKTLEILAPAGSPEALDAAVGEGADAVYLGLKDFNARLRSANFTYGQFESALRTLRRMGKKIYVTVNTVFEQREADRMYQLLKYLSSAEPDALIVQDFGVIAMARSEFPNLKLHASTQMNIASARGANALSRHGFSRVVLARELSLEELCGIKTETNLELEVFVHGALCVSVSGICLFSSFLGGKSANRGMCTQACRRLYHRSDGESGYYFSPNDLQLLERVPDLAAAGITALKIEGRMKSASYVGAVVSAYRLAADAVANGNEAEIKRSIEQGQEILRNDFARPKTQYLFNNNQLTTTINNDNNTGVDWLNPKQDGGTGISLGVILKLKGSGEERSALVTAPQGLTLSERDSVRIHRGDDSGRISHKLTFAEKEKGNRTTNNYWISAPEGKLGDHVYLIQVKETRKRYAPIITKVSGGRGPGRDRAPFPQITLTAASNRRQANRTSVYKKKDDPFPEGIYVTVSKPEDLYIAQSSRPKKVMLTLSQKTARYLLGDKPPLPFKPSEIILTLDPWFPQDIAKYEDGRMAKDIEELINKGYFLYMVNNPGHLSLFKGFDNARLIAGPWLYTFNSWSLSFTASLGVDCFVSPLENNRQNLERTLGIKSRGTEGKDSKKRYSKSSNTLLSKYFVTVFAWIPLFNIRADIGSVLNFKSFADNMNEEFLLITDRDGSRVYPKKYFSIIDKIPFLKEAGFGRFIVDLTGITLKKPDYRDLMRNVNEYYDNIRGSVQPLPNSNRFNWKDGFFNN